MSRAWCALKNAQLTGFPKRQADTDTCQNSIRMKIGDDVLEHSPTNKVSSSVSHVSPISKASPIMGLLKGDSANKSKMKANTPLPKDKSSKQERRRRYVVPGRQRNKITSWLSKQDATPHTPRSRSMAGQPPATSGNSPTLPPPPIAPPGTPEIIPVTPKQATNNQGKKRRRQNKKKQAAVQEDPPLLSSSSSDHLTPNLDPCPSSVPSCGEEQGQDKRSLSAMQAKRTAGDNLELGIRSPSMDLKANRKWNSMEKSTSKKHLD